MAGADGRVLYELAGAEPRRFSPFCWRSRFALAHKGLEAKLEPVRFCDKAKLAASGQTLVPVLVDGARTLHDSFAIACYLEDTYPDRPPLFGGAAARRLALFVNRWADYTQRTYLTRMIVYDIFRHIDPVDVPYFRENREQRFGMRLEETPKDRAERLPVFRAQLDPARQMLAEGPFLAGSAPRYVDHILMGTFQFARTVSDFPLLATDDPLYAWRERMLDLYGSLARSAPGYPC